MSLIKTTILSVLVAGSKVFSALVLNKILALFVGPQGYALVGQLQNIITSTTAIASAGVNTGVVKYTAEYHYSKKAQVDLWRTAGTVGLLGSIFIALLLISFSKSISVFFFLSDSYSYLIKLTAGFTLLYVVNTLLISVVNGLKQTRAFALINITNSLLSLLLTSFFAYYYGLKGALISLAIGQSVVVFFTIFLVRKSNWLKLSNFVGKIDVSIFKKLMWYTLITLTTSLLGPFVQSIVRGFVIRKYDLNLAGYWDAMTRVSNTYLLLITFPLTSYFLPKVSESNDLKSLKTVFMEGIKILVPLTIVCSLGLYILKDYIIVLLFSKKFLPMSGLFGWQVLGDVFRVGCWLFSYYLIAKAQIKAFIIGEIGINVGMLLLTFFWGQYSFYYIPIGYCLSNILYFAIMSIYFKKKVFRNENISYSNNI